MKKAWWIATLAVVAIGCLGLILWASLRVASLALPREAGPAPTEQVLLQPPASLDTARDYLQQGDYDFDRRDYDRALAACGRAIELDGGFAEAYNNRAYTFMTVRDYAAALTDLDKAIELRPGYVNALINRGDIYNYYYNIDNERAIRDYDRAIAADPDAVHTTSVCGHRYLAQHRGWNAGTLLGFPGAMACGAGR